MPFVERNYNLVELGPKGPVSPIPSASSLPTGADLGRRGHRRQALREQRERQDRPCRLLDCVAFDEFAANRKTDQNLVNIMKNYMANKVFNRGNIQLGAEASMAFIATRLTPCPTC